MRRIISFCLVLVVCLVSLVVPVSASETGIEIDYGYIYVSGSYVLRVPAVTVVQTGSTDLSGTNITYTNSLIEEGENTEYALVISRAPTAERTQYVSIAVLVKADTVETIGAVSKSGSYTSAIPCETSTVACTDSDKLGYMMVTAIAPWDGNSEIEFTISGQLGEGVNSFTMYVSELYVNSYSGLIPDYLDESTVLLQSILAELQTINTNLTTSNTYLKGIRTILTNIHMFLSDILQSILQAITSWGQAIVNAINGDTTSGDEFKEDSGQLNDDLGGISDSMQSVTMPDSADVDIDISEHMTGRGVTTLTGAISGVLSSGPLATMFTIAIMLMTAAYILYGKR